MRVPSLRFGLICFSLSMGLGVSLRAQDPKRVEPTQQEPTQVKRPFEGEIVRDIIIEPASEPKADLILRLLWTKVGEPLERVRIVKDEEVMWTNLNYLTDIEVQGVEGGVRVFYVVQAANAFDHFEFRGLDHFKESEVRALLGFGPRKRMSRFIAEQYAASLEARYRRDGYAFARVDPVPDEEQSRLTFFVDEGHEVEIRHVYFRGNIAFPTDNPWFWVGGEGALLDSTGIKSQPEGWFTASPYSAEIVQEDLDRLRFFYRSHGFRDAEIELAGRQFVEDFTKVDLSFRIVEGRRYTLASIDLEQEPPAGESEPLYAKEDVLASIKSRPGDYYDYTKIQRDRRAIEDYYGKRGHPPFNRFGRNLENAFVDGDPDEYFDTEKGEIRLTFRLREGTPKVLRDVKIRGNRFTQDRVIRRRVLVFPGERIDIEKVQRSINSLDSLRYFLDPVDFSGVRFELIPVPGEEDMVDLGIQVSEGDTGQFTWGAGISTGAGVQGRFQFIKQNFDITRLSSSPNPATIVGEVTRNEAFHGAGQELQLLVAPGTEVSLFQIRFSDPDILRDHIDTIGLGVDAFRSIVFRDSFDADTLGAQVSLSRNFSENVSVTVSFLQQTTEIEDIENNAPTIVFDAEGSTEMRGPRFDLRVRDLDFGVQQPAQGYDARAYFELIGGPFGGQTDFITTGAELELYWQLRQDALDRSHVFYLRNRFDFGKAFDDTDDLFVNNRFFMGGSTLRGFDQRRAGPVQFDKPLGGEARYLSSAEYRFPLVSNRVQGGFLEQEILRGVVFGDFGLLGTQIDDASFREPRLSVGFGLRITVPLIPVPIALDLGWPVFKEGTDSQRQFSFSLTR